MEHPWEDDLYPFFSVTGMLFCPSLTNPFPPNEMNAGFLWLCMVLYIQATFDPVLSVHRTTAWTIGTLFWDITWGQPGLIHFCLLQLKGNGIWNTVSKAEAENYKPVSKAFIHRRHIFFRLVQPQAQSLESALFSSAAKLSTVEALQFWSFSIYIRNRKSLINGLQMFSQMANIKNW